MAPHRPTRFKPGVLIILLTLTPLAGLLSRARAAPDCDFNPTDGRMNLIMEPLASIVERSGDDILVDGELCEDVPGNEQPTATTTSLIEVSDNAGGFQTLTLSLAGGPFAPGTEGGPSPEIPIRINFTLGCDTLRIVGSSGPDAIRAGFLLEFDLVRHAVNLNADETAEIDADVVIAGGCKDATMIAFRVEGGAGSDTISAAGGAGIEFAADYRVSLDGGDGDDLLIGGTNRDRLVGGPRRDVLRGGGGNDTLLGGAGNDALNAGGDDDALLGGAGADLLDGGSGNDSLKGEGGRDVLRGGAGADVLDGGPGFDICKGGPGRDKFKNCEKIV